MSDSEAEQDALEERLRDARISSLEAWMADIRKTQGEAPWHIVPPDNEATQIEMAPQMRTDGMKRKNRLLLYMLDLESQEPELFVEKGYLGTDRQGAMNRLTRTIVVGHLIKRIPWNNAAPAYYLWDMCSIDRDNVADLMEGVVQGQPLPHPNWLACNWPAVEQTVHGERDAHLYPNENDPYFNVKLAMYGPDSKWRRTPEHDALHSQRFWLVPKTDKVDAHFSWFHPRPGVEIEVECPHRSNEHRYTYAVRNKFHRIRDLDPARYEAGHFGAPNEYEAGEFTLVTYYKFRRIKRFRVTPGFTQDSEDPVARDNRDAVPAYPGTGNSPNAPAWVIVEISDIFHEGESMMPGAKRVSMSIADAELYAVQWLDEWKYGIDTYGKMCNSRWKALSGLIKLQAPLRRWNVESNERHYAPGGHGEALAAANWQSSTNKEKRDKTRAEWDRLTPEQRRVAEARQLRDAWEERTRGDESASPPGLSRRDRSRSFHRRRDYGEESEEEGELREPPRVQMCVGRDGLPNVSALKL